MIDNQLQSDTDREHPVTEQKALVPPVQETHLIRYDSACRALAEASAVDEVKEVLDLALKLRLYAKVAENKQMERDAVAIRAWAERRLGEMMAAHTKTYGKAKPRSGKGQRKTDRRVATQPDGPATLPEVGIDKNLAHRARKSASLTLKEFENRIAEMRKGDRGSLEIRRAKTVKRPVVLDDDADNSHEVVDQDQILPKAHRSSFLARAAQAEACAQYHGPFEPGWAGEFVTLARNVAAKWNALAAQFEQADHDGEERVIVSRENDEHERG